jgi:hypothetical protein
MREVLGVWIKFMQNFGDNVEGYLSR